MNLLDAFSRCVAEHPERIALIDSDGLKWTYRRLDARGQSLAAQFRRKGLQRGDRVLIALGIDADLYAALAALWRLGAVAVLPEPALGLAGVRHALELTKPKAALLGGIYRVLPWIVPSLRRVELQLRVQAKQAQEVPCVDLSPESPALISFTTGSTGTPKAIVRSHGFMRAQDVAVSPLIGTKGRLEIDLVGFPVFVVANLGQGITSVLPDWPARQQEKATGARIARLIERHNVTRLLINPELLSRVVDHGVPASIHTSFTGGGPVFPDLIQKVLTDRPDLNMVAVYGSTEAEPIAEIAANDIAPLDFKAMSAGHGLLAGQPVEGAQVRILNSEIQVSGEHVVKGYLDPSRDSESKVCDAQGTLWHRTGDAGYLDEHGRLWLLGRVGSDVAGFWPFAIETAARSWPGVHRAALANSGGKPMIAIEGDRRYCSEWRAKAGALGISSVAAVRSIPMDKRHGSKVDMKSLDKLLLS